MHEKDTYYLTRLPVSATSVTAFKVVTKTAEGAPTGEYVGYYNDKRGVITLYPAKGSWIYGRLQKHEISIYDRRVKNA